MYYYCHYNYHHRFWYRSLLLPIRLGYNQLSYDATKASYCDYYYYHYYYYYYYYYRHSSYHYY